MTLWRWLPTLLLLALPAQAQDSTARLRADLLAGPSATQVLTRYCDRLGLATPPVVRAVRDRAQVPATAQVRALLHVGADTAIRYRRVHLTCGTHVLSEAENWYVPSRLTPAMNRTLDETETSFGTVVRPLGFHRKTLDAAPVHEPRTILRVRALLLTGDGTPFSLVVENYSPDLVVGGSAQ